jgi:phage baseplate assembly protein gpV
MQNGAQLTINASQTLSVCGTWKGGASSNASVLGAGAVVMTGAAAQSINGKTSFVNLTINNTGGLTKVLGSVDIKTALTLQRGNFSNTGTVTLKSDANGTGYLDNFTYLSTAGNYTGNLTVERYLFGISGI